MAIENSYDLGPSEYDAAAQRFVGEGVKALMEAQGDVYSLVRKESLSELPDNSLAASDESLVRGQTIELSSEGSASFDGVVNGDFDEILASMDHIAMEMSGQASSAILSHISEVCNQTGNVVNGPLSWDVVADAIERMEFSFDEEGNHNLTIVLSPEGAEKLRSLGDPTPEQQRRLDSIIDQRRDEWNARRRSRSLPPRRD